MLTTKIERRDGLKAFESIRFEGERLHDAGSISIAAIPLMVGKSFHAWRQGTYRNASRNAMQKEATCGGNSF